jgi:hypothetical protein
MRSERLGLAMATLASAMVVSTGAFAIAVETTNFISSPTYFNGFEGIGAVSSSGGIIYSGAPYSEGGITVQYVGSVPNGIWTAYTPTIGGQGNYGWYPNGGGNGYTEITLTGGGDFQSVQFLTGNGGAGAFTQYELLNNGVVVASGYTSNPGRPMGYLGFSGGGFDEILIQSLGSSSALFNPTGFEDLAIDSIAATAATPLPAALPLFATGLGGLGLLGWRRKRKAQVAV